VIFRFIAAKKAEHSIKTMCRVLGVSRSGFHAWAGREPSARALEDERLTERIREIHSENRCVYGSPRIHAELAMADGVRVGRKRVERLMRQAGITGVVARKRGKTTIRVAGVRVCEDLVDRAFLAAAPDRLWVADITYLRTWEGWLYLVAVQDVFSRRIVGWSMGDHMRSELVTDALQMALAKRRPAPGLIWHSDQGSQFVSLAFGQQARAAGIAQSMGSRGDCFVQRGRRELLRVTEEGAHPRPLLADQGRTAHGGLRVHRDLLQPPPASLDARNALARRLRAEDSEPGRNEPRRFAARTHQQDHAHCVNDHEGRRLETPCPPKRGKSSE
jgi:putative transposase